MESSNVNERKIKVKTQAKVLGKTEVEWEIEGWNGPMGHQLRSRVTCHVNIPSQGNSELRLRFHLKPYQSHEEPDQKFCNQRVKYVPRSIDCSCYTCKTVPLSATTAELPGEFMPKCPTRSAGYSLLVDVLNAPQNDVILGVSGKILNGDDSAIPFNSFVTVDPGSAQNDISVIDNFCPMVKWTEDKSGNISNCAKTPAITGEDARFLFTVTVYRIEEIGTDKDPSPTATARTHLVKPTAILNTYYDEVDFNDPTTNVIWNGTLEFLRKDDGENSSKGEWKTIETCQAVAVRDADEFPVISGNGWPNKLKIELRRTETVVVSDGKLVFENGIVGDIMFALGEDEDDDDFKVHKSIKKLLDLHVGVVLFNENADATRKHLSTPASRDKGLLFVRDEKSDVIWGITLNDEPASRAIIRNVEGSLKEEKTKKTSKKLRYLVPAEKE